MDKVGVARPKWFFCLYYFSIYISLPSGTVFNTVEYENWKHIFEWIKWRLRTTIWSMFVWALNFLHEKAVCVALEGLFVTIAQNFKANGVFIRIRDFSCYSIVWCRSFDRVSHPYELCYEQSYSWIGQNDFRAHCTRMACNRYLNSWGQLSHICIGFVTLKCRIRILFLLSVEFILTRFLTPDECVCHVEIFGSRSKSTPNRAK